MSEGKLVGKTAIVTGAGTGLGTAIAECYAREGAAVVLVGRRANLLEQVAKQIEAAGARALVHAADVSQEADVERLVRVTTETFGALDILVNNAGIAGPVAPIWETPLEGWLQTLAVNLTGPWLCAREALRVMVPRRSGKIINIGSISGKRPLATRTPYTASKLGLVGLTRTLAVEAGPYNINVNHISPGLVDTPRLLELAQKWNRDPDELRASFGAQAALNRIAEPLDIANCALFLASEDSRNITGFDISVDAGTWFS